MTIAIMQPYFMPYIGYFQLIKSVDKFILLDDVNYIKKGWINRNRILVNGNDYMFTIPLKNVSQNKLIKDMELDDSQSWENKLLKTIEYNYKNAEYFLETYALVKDVISFNKSKLSKFLYHSIEATCNYLDIQTEIIPSSEKYNNEDLKGENRIINICKKEKADTYINAIGGMELYSKEKFNSNGIELKFLETEKIEYPQNSNEFIPFLSIIDMLMYLSIDNIKINLDRYILK